MAGQTFWRMQEFKEKIGDFQQTLVSPEMAGQTLQNC